MIIFLYLQTNDLQILAFNEMLQPEEKKTWHLLQEILGNFLEVFLFIIETGGYLIRKFWFLVARSTFKLGKT